MPNNDQNHGIDQDKTNHSAGFMLKYHYCELFCFNNL